MGEYKDIPLSQLELNPRNPRLIESDNDLDALRELLSSQGRKLFALAEDIAQHGLNPAEQVIVSASPYSDGKMIVNEGNRRIASLKIIDNPSLISGCNSTLEASFRKLSERYRSTVQKIIRCYVTEDSSEIRMLMELKHGGEQNGKGTVKWGSAEKARFQKQVYGKTSPAQALIRYMEERGLIEKDWVTEKNLSETNLNRFLGFVSPRKSLGITGQGNNLRFDSINEEKTLKLLEDMASDSFNVGRIYHKENAEEYICDLFGKDSSDSAPVSLADSSEELAKEAPTDTRKRITPSFPTLRSHLVARGQSIPIREPRPKRVFEELRKLDVDVFPNAVAVLFRTFVIMSCDAYLENVKTKANEKSSLSKKIKVTTEQLSHNNKIDKGCSQAVNSRRSEDISSDSPNIATLHAFVHHASIQPDSETLRVMWDDFYPYLRALWEDCCEPMAKTDSER